MTGLVGFRMAPGVIPADDGQVACRRITDRVKHCSARALGSWISVAWVSDSQATPSAVTAPAATGSRNSMTSEVAFLLALGVLLSHSTYEISVCALRRGALSTMRAGIRWLHWVNQHYRDGRGRPRVWRTWGPAVLMEAESLRFRRERREGILASRDERPH